MIPQYLAKSLDDEYKIHEKSPVIKVGWFFGLFLARLKFVIVLAFASYIY